MVIPSIDLMDGKVVQLKQGREKVLERDDAADLLRGFDRFGETAIVDLNAAMDRGDNREAIRLLLKQGDGRIGGGIRDLASAREFISWGANKIMVGSRAFEGDQVDHGFLSALSAGVGPDRLIVAIDARQGHVVTRAWTHDTGLDLFAVVQECARYCGEFLYTCVEKEGCMSGTDIATVTRLAAATDRRITVAGGITSLDDIRELSRLGVNCQLGMALYTGRIDLADAFIESLDWSKGLIPTIAQDESGRVLTLAFSSRESLKNIFATGEMWYFSRSRNELWHKGGTSGHTQKFIRIRPDCDCDALLVRVRPKGPACHTGDYSCFGGRTFGLDDLLEVIRDRVDRPRPGSYTAGLTDGVLKEKIMEEAAEVTAAQTRDEIIWEISDVIYFLTVLMAKNGLGYADITAELRRRRWQ